MSSPDCRPSLKFERLNQDVLLEIIEELQRTKDLGSLSLTCRWLRDLCQPVLFSRTFVQSTFLQKAFHRVFPAQSIWLHIRELTFLGAFRQSYGSSVHPGYPYDEVASWLQDAFQQMPRLEAVVIRGTKNLGVPCLVLKSILGAPHLRSFKLAEPVAREEFLASDDLRFTITSSLRHFSYINLDYYRLHPRCSQVEVQLVVSVLEQASESLVTLVLPCEPTLSFERFAARSWRNLRTLSLTGERPSQPSDQPLISLLSRMPSLQTLSLEIASSVGVDPEPVWPAWFDASFPWPDLRSLSIAFPHAEDQIYSHFPPSLSSLRLCCWPRHYVHQSWPELESPEVLRWRSPILGASGLLPILSRCASSHLDELDVEYKQDGDEVKVLQALTGVFPNVTTLTLYRYRTLGAHDIDVVELSRVLAAFKRLRILRVHLDFVDQPHPLSTMHGRTSLFKMREAFVQHANTFACNLGWSVEVVCFLDRETAFNRWYPFRIVAGRHGQRVAHFDPSVADEYGLRMSDAHGPTYKQALNPADTPLVRWVRAE
ncbi:hypothetical protein OH77DRAFT_1463738 [Trametes cingulata]|nr:hypothetical protein OH77DRAFT_1463738 [Trametes cingulata]